MIKVLYPYDKDISVLKESFNDRYYNKVINYINGDVNELDNLLSRNINYKNEELNLKKIITADFVELVEMVSLINQDEETKKRICKYFEKIVNAKKTSVYKGAQGAISNFFMEENLNLKACYYCNIDNINVFEERYTYNSAEDFINNAPKEVLLLFNEISKETAEEIILNRHLTSVYDYLDKILSSIVYNRLKREIIDKWAILKVSEIIIKKNQFTLDHFLPKKEFPYFSLSLYNLIPSCSSCNCKFKGSLEFLPDAKLKFLSPSSTEFSLSEDLEFNLLFNVMGNDLKEVLENVNSHDSFEIKIIDKNENTGFETFLNMFKLRGRYEFHKNVAFEMISKRKIYSDSQVNEFSELLIRKGINKDAESIKKDIFGSSIFNDEEKNESFAKYKKSIAEQLGLII